VSSPLETEPKMCPGKGRGRPRAFDEALALEAATRVFADKGFEGASLSDLTEAMGINRVSMYATFGNKEALFVKAMNRFSCTSEDRVKSCLSASTAREAVERLLHEGVRMFTSPDGPGVCFVTQGPFEVANASEETRSFMAHKRSGIERMLRGLFEQSIESGKLSRNVSAEQLARFYSVVIQGMALQAQHGGTKEQLESVIEVAMSAWPAAF